MKKQVLMACLAVVAGASAGTATYSFSWYRNAHVTDFPVPLVLEEGHHAISRHHIDLPIGEIKKHTGLRS